jgi:hypothetical protein
VPKAHPIWTKEWISTATLNVVNGSHGNTLTEVDSPFIFIDKETLSFRSEGISYIDIIKLITNKISKVFVSKARKQYSRNGSHSNTLPEINRDHSPNFFRQTSLLFHKWLAERFNLDGAWIVNVRYEDTSIYNALITWIGKLCTFHKQNCSHDFFYFINYNIIVQVK